MLYVDMVYCVEGHVGIFGFFSAMKRGQDDPVVGDTDESRKKARTDDPALLSQVKKQVEFYFSDSNYPRDKFMKETAEKNDGCT